MIKIIIIGANSYIARNMIAICNAKYNNIELKLYDIHNYQIDGFAEYEQIDITNRESVKRIDLICDIVFLFSGKTGSADGFDDYNNFIDINEKGLLNLLDEFKRQKSNAKLVFPSTRLVYKGKTGKLVEDSEKEFKTIYAINKYACEQYLQQFNSIFDIKYCIFRICVPYGTLVEGASSYGTIGFMLKKAQNRQPITIYGNGEVRRSLTYIEDLCHMLILGALSNECNNSVYNIGGEDYSLREMAELVANTYKGEVAYVDYPEVSKKIESGSTVFDDSKLQKILNYKPRMSFKKWCDLSLKTNE